MFWIGLIVGMLAMLGLVIAYFAWCLRVLGMNRNEVNEFGAVLYTACANREATIEVYHDDECLYEAVFEEN